MAHGEQGGVSVTAATDPIQYRFEDAVFAVMMRRLETGQRIDLVVSGYIDRLPFDAAGDSLRADLIICVADCTEMVRRIADDAETAKGILAMAHASWGAVRHPDPAVGNRDTTRVQRCIGNIRRALAAAVAEGRIPTSQ